MNPTHEQVLQAYDAAPQAVRDVYNAEGTTQLIVDICKSYGLVGDVAHALGSELGYLLLRLIKPADFAIRLRAAGVPDEAVQAMAIAVNEKIIVPLRSQVSQTAPQSSLPRYEETPVTNSPPPAVSVAAPSEVSNVLPVPPSSPAAPASAPREALPQPRSPAPPSATVLPVVRPPELVTRGAPSPVPLPVPAKRVSNPPTPPPSMPPRTVLPKSSGSIFHHPMPMGRDELGTPLSNTLSVSAAPKSTPPPPPDLPTGTPPFVKEGETLPQALSANPPGRIPEAHRHGDPGRTPLDPYRESVDAP